MARVVKLGAQYFRQIREGGFFYVDKTDFLRRWWESGDDVTLVCRPRRFGKTLALTTAECFFSTHYAGRGEELFGDLDVWKSESMRRLEARPCEIVPVASLACGAS